MAAAGAGYLGAGAGVVPAWRCAGPDVRCGDLTRKLAFFDAPVAGFSSFVAGDRLAATTNEHVEGAPTIALVLKDRHGQAPQ